MKKCRTLYVLSMMFGALVLLPWANGQSPTKSANSSHTMAPVAASSTYTRPSERTKLKNYLFDSFGPYPIAGAALAAGIGQADDSPTEWGQGAAGYGRRVGSDFGIAFLTTSVRYGMAEVFREDTLYYPCDCKGSIPRFRHALISTVTVRRGNDGHRVFSFPSLAAPYIGAVGAVYAWYPRGYGIGDGLELGNYNLLGVVAGNMAMEFLQRGPHSLLGRLHLGSSQKAQPPASNP